MKEEALLLSQPATRLKQRVEDGWRRWKGELARMKARCPDAGPIEFELKQPFGQSIKKEGYKSFNLLWTCGISSVLLPSK